jgi:hypothetical protein
MQTTIKKVHSSDSFVMFEVNVPATPNQTFVEAKVAANTLAKSLVETPQGFRHNSTVFHRGNSFHTVELHFTPEF